MVSIVLQPINTKYTRKLKWNQMTIFTLKSFSFFSAYKVQQEMECIPISYKPSSQVISHSYVFMSNKEQILVDMY